MGAQPWNHSVHYHDLLLRAAPLPCASALDVGCGDGSFARQLAARADSVTGVDRSERMISLAVSESARIPNVRFLLGDFLSLPLPGGSFDFVTAICAVHHMPFEPAISRMQALLRPGGVLAVLGLARERAPRDFLVSAAAVPVSRVRSLGRPSGQAAFDVRPPSMSYGDVRRSSAALLPGSEFRRLLFFRYLLVWRNGGARTG